MTDTLTLHEALMGGPGLDGYVFEADVYCVECGQQLVRDVLEPLGGVIEFPDAGDSDTLPQPIFFGESDTAQHCGECSEYLYGGDD